MRRLAESFYLLATTAWVGGMWAVGYLVAPALFAHLGDRQQAGVMAGHLFGMMAWLGLAAASYIVLFLLIRLRAQAFRLLPFWLALLLASLVAAGHFGIQPIIVQLKADAWPRDVMESVMRDRFVAWHGVSSILYLLQSVLGAGLVLTTGRGLGR